MHRAKCEFVYFGIFVNVEHSSQSLAHVRIRRYSERNIVVAFCRLVRLYPSHSGSVSKRLSCDQNDCYIIQVFEN